MDNKTANKDERIAIRNLLDATAIGDTNPVLPPAKSIRVIPCLNKGLVNASVKESSERNSLLIISQIHFDYKPVRKPGD